MCHPQYAEMIRYAKKAGVNIVTSFTNGIYLKNNIAALLDAPIDLLEINADAANYENYMKWRRNPILIILPKQCANFFSHGTKLKILLRDA